MHPNKLRVEIGFKAHVYLEYFEMAIIFHRCRSVYTQEYKIIYLSLMVVIP